jgi:hypothetical protein
MYPNFATPDHIVDFEREPDAAGGQIDMAKDFNYSFNQV